MLEQQLLHSFQRSAMLRLFLAENHYAVKATMSNLPMTFLSTSTWLFLQAPGIDQPKAQHPELSPLRGVVTVVLGTSLGSSLT